LIPYFQENFRGALKTRVRVHDSRPVCWHFCWYLGEQTFAAPFAIPNKGIEQMARKNDGASANPNTSTARAPVIGLEPDLAVADLACEFSGA
jgi:hypothetical protein